MDIITNSLLLTFAGFLYLQCAAGMFIPPFLDRRYVKIQLKDGIKFDEVLGLLYEDGVPGWMKNVENRRPAEYYSVYIEMQTGWSYISHNFQLNNRLHRIDPLTHIPEKVEARIDNQKYSLVQEFTTYDVKGRHPNARALSQGQARLFMAIKGSTEVYTAIIQRPVYA